MYMFVNNKEKGRIALPRKHVYLTRSTFIMLLDTITLCICPTDSSDGTHTHTHTHTKT